MTMTRKELKRQLDALRDIEYTMSRQPLDKQLADIHSGQYYTDLRAQLDAQGITAEAQTANGLYKCDIYVDADLIVYQVTRTFPEIDRQRVLTWLCRYAEDHHEIYISKATANTLTD